MLDELEGIFRTEGVADLSIGDLARRLGTSRTTLYRLAPRKEKLIELVIDRMFRRFSEATAAEVENAETPADKLAACIHAGAVCDDSPPALAFDLASSPGASMLREKYLEGRRNLLAGLIEHGTSSGAFRPVSVALIVQAADAAQARLRESVVLEEIGMNCEQAAECLADLLLRGIGGDDPRRAVRPLTG